MLRNGLEPWHLLIVAIVIILLFGSKKLPEAARALGNSLRILKTEAKAMKDDAVTTVQPLRKSWNHSGENDVQPGDGHS
ncbi:Sec-independent protein translocase subunit TatA [Streptomyces broussonetiae]|uniref:Sec-independent protein translocase protein TatA n=1 Tax=Streptomyces broussonetiae TaxID=2686304 RepID=A0A6I6MUH3_9ACTN|nr:Sec-independent protein translocase subunit TatA [Streptomyces broussonetiae]QHA02684.1 twin-arginine translocase TatA/TatE family subunit [Streptomyces broussonetiae]